MRALLLAIGLGLAVATVCRSADAAKDLEKLQGTWVAEEIFHNGKDYSKYRFRLVVKGEQMTLEGNDEVKKDYAKIAFKLDPATTPPCLDLKVSVGDQEGAKMEGIYELKGDTLKLCVNVFGQDRPNQFKSEEGSSVALVVLKREK
jgi:uncharacterized protein (TIGR03067 family)